jgi:type I pantothenate kinase
VGSQVAGAHDDRDADARYRSFARRLGTELLARPVPPVPVVAVVGGVAVGKSVAARTLARLLGELPDRPRVEVVSTDGFLFPNAELAARGLTMRKGFPESYDVRALTSFLSRARAGAPELRVPVYSHEWYDIVPGEQQLVRAPRILVVEGLALTSSDVTALLDAVVYIDADERDIEQWFLARFLTMFPADRLDVAHLAWRDINVVNLHEHILPARDDADVVIVKGPDHRVQRVQWRRCPHDTMGG